jgi:hypothetical protein
MLARPAVPWRLDLLAWAVGGVPEVAADGLERMALSVDLLTGPDPMRRNTAIGGHQPWMPCWSRNGRTTAGSSSHRRLTMTPRVRPVNAYADALTSRIRSVSDSRFQLGQSDIRCPPR